MKKVMMCVFFMIAAILLVQAQAFASTSRETWLVIRSLEKELAPFWPKLKEAGFAVNNQTIDFKTVKPADYLARLVMWRDAKEMFDKNPMIAGFLYRQITGTAASAEVVNAKPIKCFATASDETGECRRVVLPRGTIILTNRVLSQYEIGPEEELGEPQDSWLEDHPEEAAEAIGL
ncbi:MAG: hypothetical protein M1338_00380 [Patescibacteria group bacterium]|nr:hypothetical protein [Patescibacteria group bacterium]